MECVVEWFFMMYDIGVNLMAYVHNLPLEKTYVTVVA
jgi:hypothetical protein